MPKLTKTDKEISKFNLSCVGQPMTEEYATALWNSVSGAVECGGFGNGSWGFDAQHDATQKGWQDYNKAGEHSHGATTGILYAELLINVRMEEDGKPITDYSPVTCYWLHGKMVEFVNDPKTPEWLRVMYAGMLITRDNPSKEDAVSSDAFMQYCFLKEIRFG